MNNLKHSAVEVFAKSNSLPSPPIDHQQITKTNIIVTFDLIWLYWQIELSLINPIANIYQRLANKYRYKQVNVLLSRVNIAFAMQTVPLNLQSILFVHQVVACFDNQKLDE